MDNKFFYEVEIVGMFTRGYNSVHTFESEMEARKVFYSLIDDETQVMLVKVKKVTDVCYTRQILDICGGNGVWKLH